MPVISLSWFQQACLEPALTLLAFGARASPLAWRGQTALVLVGAPTCVTWFQVTFLWVLATMSSRRKSCDLI